MRDASGNVMATYNMATSGGVTYATWSEADIYGSSRVATYNPKFNMLDGRPPLVNIPKIGDIAYYYNFSRGLKLFELTNHLGNVLATVTDTKIPVNNGNTISYYTANLVNATEYAPFGMRLRGRDSTLQAYNSAYRFGYNGKEQDKSISSQDYDYGMRIYDARMSRFLSVDPIAKEYPELTPYQYASDRPIDGIDRDGLEHTPAGLNAPYGPRDNTAVQTMPLDATTVQKVNVQSAARVNYLNQWIIAPDISGKGHIGPRYAVNANVAITNRNYYNAVGDNIAGGPGGATGYLIAGEKGSFVGAAADQIMYSFGGFDKEGYLSKVRVNIATEPSEQSTSNTASAYSFIRTETPSGNKAAAGVGANIKIINEGGQLAPVEVAEINSKLYIINGHHRVEAAKMTNTELRYQVLTKEQWQAYGYKTESDIIGAAAEASTQKVKLDKKVIQKVSGQSTQ